MAKSYGEQIKELQNRISALKKQQKEQVKKRTHEVGEVVVRLMPELRVKFNEEDFNLEDYLKNKLGLKEEISEANESAETVQTVQQEQPAVESRPAYGTYNQNQF